MRFAISALLVFAALGCNGGGGSSKKSGSTTAPTTSSTPPAPITSSAPPRTVNASLKIVSAILEDTNGDHIVSKGDTLTVRFSQPVVVTATSPIGEVEPLIPGDTFGFSATLAPITTVTTDVAIVLGTGPKLKVTGTFSAIGTGPYQPSGVDIAATVAKIQDAKGLLPATSGGVDVTSTQLVEGCFTVGTGMKFSRGLHTATLLDDGTVLIVCGVEASGPGTSNYQRENELFDPLTGSSSLLSSTTLGGSPGGYMSRKSASGLNIKVGRIAHTATKLANGQVLIAGGNGFEDTTAGGTIVYSNLASCFLYDPATHTFTETGKLTTARRDHSAVLIAGGTKVLAFGGRDANGTMASSEIFDTATGTWSAGPSMVTGRYDCSVVSTPTGVHVLGGGTITATGTYTDVTQDEIYDPASNAFAAAPVSLSPERHNPAGALLDTGDILLAGGNGGGKALTTIARFDRLLAQWMPAGDLVAARQRHVACRVEGDVLVAGGMTIDAAGAVKTVDTVETIGASGPIKSTPLGFARLSGTVTLLKDGRVLIVGGFRNPTKDIRGMDGTSVAPMEVFVRP